MNDTQIPKWWKKHKATLTTLLFIVAIIVVTGVYVGTRPYPHFTATWTVSEGLKLYNFCHDDLELIQPIPKDTPLDWGAVREGTNTYIYYIKNVGAVDLTLLLVVNNINPSDYSLTWDSDGKTLSADDFTQITFTLTVPVGASGSGNVDFKIVGMEYTWG